MGLFFNSDIPALTLASNGKVSLMINAPKRPFTNTNYSSFKNEGLLIVKLVLNAIFFKARLQYLRILFGGLG